MPGRTAVVTPQRNAPKNSPLQAYHSNVVQTMCTQMVHQRRKPTGNGEVPLPLAKKPSKTSSQKQPLKQHVEEEMARRSKADKVLQDLSSDKSRQQARARETARRTKWAKTVAETIPSAGGPTTKPKVVTYEGNKRKNPQVA